MISLKYIFRNNFGNRTPISKVPRKYHTITLFIKKEKIGNFRTSTLFFSNLLVLVIGRLGAFVILSFYAF